jgi:hypothetical protein
MKRPLIVAGILVSTLALTSVSAYAAWVSAGTGEASAMAGSLAEPTDVAVAALDSQSLRITWQKPATTPEPTSYTVHRVGGPSTPVCTKASNEPYTCDDTGLQPSTSYSYVVTSVLQGWTAAAGPKSGTTNAAAVAPAAPTSVALQNGQGVGNAYVNLANRSGVNFRVELPTSSLSTDTVTLTVTGSSGTPVQATKSATLGAGAVDFTGLNLSGLADGALMASAVATNVTGSSAATANSTPISKDTGVPTATAAVHSGTAGTNGFYTSNVTVRLTATDSLSGVKDIKYSASGAQTIGETTVAGSPADVSLTTEGTTSITYWAVDNAGNAAATKTFEVKIDKMAPINVAITNSPSGRTPTISGTAGILSTDVASVSINVSCRNRNNNSLTTLTATATVTSGQWTHTTANNAIPNANDCSATATQLDQAGNSTTSSPPRTWST